jgi:hypothetical protein
MIRQFFEDFDFLFLFFVFLCYIPHTIYETLEEFLIPLKILNHYIYLCHINKSSFLRINWTTCYTIGIILLLWLMSSWMIWVVRFVKRRRKKKHKTTQKFWRWKRWKRWQFEAEILHFVYTQSYREKFLTLIFKYPKDPTQDKQNSFLIHLIHSHFTRPSIGVVSLGKTNFNLFSRSHFSIINYSMKAQIFFTCVYLFFHIFWFFFMFLLLIN